MHNRARATHATALGRAARRVVSWISIGCAASAAAEQTAPMQPDGVVVSSVLERVVANPTEGGLPLEVAAGTVASHADQLIVSVQFTNASSHVLDAVRVTSPVPPDVAYVADSATGPGSRVLYSVDQGRTFGQPGELKVVDADGALRAATAADYTHVRWILDAALDVGASGTVRFRAVPR